MLKQKMKNKKKSIVILHGWMLYGSRYSAIQKIFEAKSYKVYAPDLPGFGEEPMMKEIMTIDDYILFLKHFLDRNKLEKIVLIGHSFGGRVASKFAFIYPDRVDKLILTGSPLIRHKLKFRKKVISYIGMSAKYIFKFLPSYAGRFFRKIQYRLIGEWDYYKAGKMSSTFREIIAENYNSVLPKIEVPTLVIWGELDTFVSFKDGEKIAEIIPNAKFEMIRNSGHKLPYEKPENFAESVLRFIEHK